jgi:hypothetical protein
MHCRISESCTADCSSRTYGMTGSHSNYSNVLKLTSIVCITSRVGSYMSCPMEVRDSDHSHSPLFCFFFFGFFFLRLVAGRFFLGAAGTSSCQQD